MPHAGRETRRHFQALALKVSARLIGGPPSHNRSAGRNTGEFMHTHRPMCHVPIDREDRLGEGADGSSSGYILPEPRCAVNRAMSART